MKIKILCVFFILLYYPTFCQEKLGIKTLSIGINDWFEAENIPNGKEISKNYTLGFSKLLDSLAVNYEVVYHPNFQNQIKKQVDIKVIGIITTDGFGRYSLETQIINTHTTKLITYSSGSSLNLEKRTQAEVVKTSAWQVHSWLSIHTIPSITILAPKILKKPDFKISISHYFSASPQNKQIAKNITHITNNFLASQQKNTNRDSIFTWNNYEYLPLYLKNDTIVDTELNISGTLMEMDNQLLLSLSLTSKKELSHRDEGGNKILYFFYLDKNKALNGDYSEFTLALTHTLFTSISLNFNKIDVMRLQNINFSPAEKP